MWNASEFEDVAPGAMAALGASQVAMALVEACGGLNPSSSSPSRAAVSASRAIHEVTHALARADAWVSVTSTEEDEVDSDDEKEIRESRAKSALGARCRRALWRLRSPLAAAYRVEIQWYSEASSHRGPFVAAIADLKDEIGGDALSLATGEYDAPGAAAAAARQRSTVARGCEGVAETLHVADLAERDGDDERAAKARKAASAALTSSSVRFAWLVRTAPPSEIAREWEGNKDASAVAALEEMARYMAGVADKNSVEERDEEEDSDDDGEAREYFRKKAEKRATMADVRRVTVRRFCLLLGQIKRKRLDSVFTQRRELLQSLHNSSSTLLRAKAKKVPGAGENHSNETVFLANEVAATASMAAIATRRLLENVLGSRQDSEQAAQLAAPLLSLLDSGERDSASSVVCELVAPLALLDGSVLSDVLGRIAHDRSESSLDAIRSILLHAAVDERSASPDQVESRRRVRKRIAEDLVAWLVVGPKDPKAALMAEGIGNLFGKLDADVVVPLVCSRLCDLEGTARPAGDDEGSDDAGTKPGSFNPSNACRIALENALGTCIAENRDSATAVDLLACALRETRPGASKPQSTTPLDSPGSIANATASPESTPAGDDGVILASWVERVLDRVPNWIVKIAALGGDRWVRTAESTARSASTHSKDAISLRIWGGVCDSLSEEYATFRSFRRITKIMHSQGDLVSLEQAGDENLLFERLAPLLALKRVPAQLWTVSIERDVCMI